MDIEAMNSKRIDQIELTPATFEHILENSVGQYSAETLQRMMSKALARKETWLMRVWTEW